MLRISSSVQNNIVALIGSEHAGTEHFINNIFLEYTTNLHTGTEHTTQPFIDSYYLTSLLT